MKDLCCGKKVLITGGDGLLGSHIVKYLVSCRAHVIILDSLIPKYGGNHCNLWEFKDKGQVNYSDVKGSHALRYLIHGVDYLFNLVGQSIFLDFMHDPFINLDKIRDIIKAWYK